VPTALRCKVRPISPLNAALACDASTGGSAAIRSGGDFAGESSSVVSTHGRRAKIPGFDGWADGTRVAGSPGSVAPSSYAVGGSAEAAATAAK
jgi:hypothetical protein